MEALVQVVSDNIQSYDWNSPFTMLIVIMGFLALLKKWGMFMTLMITIILGIGGTNLIIMNAETAKQLVSVPMFVYTAGGIVLAIVTLFSYIKYTIS
jgi:hypothetical protein